MKHLDLKTVERINKKNRIRSARMTYVIEMENDVFWFLRSPLTGRRMIVNKRTKWIEH